MADAKPIIRYIELWCGRCGLSNSSVASIYSEQGRANVRSVRNATEQEVAWVRGMGGYVPEGRIAKATGST